MLITRNNLRTLIGFTGALLLAPTLSYAMACISFGTPLLMAVKDSAQCEVANAWYKKTSDSCKSADREYRRYTTQSQNTHRTAAALKASLAAKVRNGQRLPQVVCYPEMALRSDNRIWQFEQVAEFSQAPAVFFLTKKPGSGVSGLPADPVMSLPTNVSEYDVENANPAQYGEDDVKFSGSLQGVEPGPSQCEFRQKISMQVVKKANGYAFTVPMVCEGF